MELDSGLSDRGSFDVIGANGPGSGQCTALVLLVRPLPSASTTASEPSYRNAKRGIGGRVGGKDEIGELDRSMSLSDNRGGIG